MVPCNQAIYVTCRCHVASFVRTSRSYYYVFTPLRSSYSSHHLHHAAPPRGAKAQSSFCRAHVRRARTFIQSCLPTRTAPASGVASDQLQMPPNRKRPVVRYVAIFRTARPWSCTRVYRLELLAPHACTRAAACIQPLRAAQSSARQCCGRCHDHASQFRRRLAPPDPP